MEKILTVLFFTLLGAALGSFLNVVASRSVSGRPWWGKERSRCPSCGQGLSWTDLFPLLSWILLKGKCRYCGKPIAIRYFAVEVTGAVIGGSLAARWGLTLPLAFALPAAFGLLLNALTDWRKGMSSIFSPLSWGVRPAAAPLRRGGMPGRRPPRSSSGIFRHREHHLVSRGDGVGRHPHGRTGSLLGWKFTLLTLYLGMVGGIIVLLLLAAKKVRRKDAVPLVPFLALGLLTLLRRAGGPSFYRVLSSMAMVISRHLLDGF
ncbi:hypothetical protein MASR2M79_19080 [Aminivibrio sp.]